MTTAQQKAFEEWRGNLPVSKLIENTYVTQQDAWQAGREHLIEQLLSDEALHAAYHAVDNVIFVPGTLPNSSKLAGMKAIKAAIESVEEE